MKSFLFVLLTCLALRPLGVSAESVFSEINNNLIVWDDITIPADKSYDSVIVVDGAVDFYAKAENLVVLEGSVRLMSGSELLNPPTVLKGRIEQQPGAIISSDVPPSEENRFFLHEPRKKFDELWKEWKEPLKGLEVWSWIALPFIIAIPAAIGAVIFLLSALFLLIAPRFAKGAEWNLRKAPLISFAWGLGAFLGLIPVLVLLAISIVGIPTIPILVVLALLAAFAGLISGCLGLGRALLLPLGLGSYWIASLLGLSILVSLQFLPWAGPTLGGVIWIAGTGALLRSLSGRHSAQWSDSVEVSYKISQ